jgi:hypothetical protein
MGDDKEKLQQLIAAIRKTTILAQAAGDAKCLKELAAMEKRASQLLELKETETQLADITRLLDEPVALFANHPIFKGKTPEERRAILEATRLRVFRQRERARFRAMAEEAQRAEQARLEAGREDTPPLF